MRGKHFFAVGLILAQATSTTSAQQRSGPILTGNNIAVVSPAYGILNSNLPYLMRIF
jgi:hypothetical protein